MEFFRNKSEVYFPSLGWKL